MAISRIKTDGIQDEAVTSAKIGDNIDLDGQFVRVPHGTTAERPGSPAAGYLRFNTTIGTLEQWNTNTSSWAAVDSPPIITSVAYPGSVTAADPAGGETITVNGSNFKSGFTVTVGGTTAPTTTFVSSTQITFTTPAKTAGDYDIVVTNTNGLAATSTNGISFNGLPAFTTAAGNVGSVTGGDVMSTITIVAAEPDGGTLAYSVTSGALPSGTSLGSANGEITGTPASPSSTTTYNFTVTATDDESQTNSRAFNLIVVRPVYGTPLSTGLKLERTQSGSMTRTPASDGNKQTWSLSFWYKKSVYGEAGFGFGVLGAGSGVFNRRTDISFGVSASNNNLNYITDRRADAGTYYSQSTTSQFTDTTSWTHFMVVQDTTQADVNDRLKWYVNGEELTIANGSLGSWAASSLTLNYQTLINNSSYLHRLFDGNHDTVTQYADGYFADMYFIDGTAKAPTDFAEEYEGAWVPKAYSGTYGSQGWHLDFSDASDLGADSSGNNNDWTVSNITADDHTPDSPTNNFATMMLNASLEEKQGNLYLETSRTGYWDGTIATHGVNSGKWYYEVRPTFGGSDAFRSAVGWVVEPYQMTLPWNQRGTTGSPTNTMFNNYMNPVWDSVYWKNGSTNGTKTAASSGNIINVAVDFDAGKIWFGINGTYYQNDGSTGGDPGAGTGESMSGMYDAASTGWHYVPAILIRSDATVGGNTATFNFGQDSTFYGNLTAASNSDTNGIGEFQYAVPTGFKALCSKNIAESSISQVGGEKMSEYFNTVLWEANGSGAVDRSITGLGFQPDFVWSKTRDSGYHHALFDSTRGPSNHLATDRSEAENTVNGGRLSSFDSDGFTWTTNGSAAQWYNETGREYVAWGWKAGGQPTATNSAGAGNVPTSGSVMIDGVASTSALAGTIAATKISANTKAGVSIVAYQGNDASSATVGHGLSQAPEMVIVKNRQEAITGPAWPVYHSSLGATKYLDLQTTAAEGTATSVWNDTAPTSTVVTIGTADSVNSGSTHIMYCFHSVEGFSKFGFYNSVAGSADGPDIYLGFRPALIIIKSGSGGRNWIMFDNKRKSKVGNPTGVNIFANTAGAETDNSGYNIDMLANGFKLRGQGGEINTSSEKYYFAAWAENPFKYAASK